MGTLGLIDSANEGHGRQSLRDKALRMCAYLRYGMRLADAVPEP
jgi:hypothetical protein